jgi:hypothetical protein
LLDARAMRWLLLASLSAGALACSAFTDLSGLTDDHGGGGAHGGDAPSSAASAGTGGDSGSGAVGAGASSASAASSSSSSGAGGGGPLGGAWAKSLGDGANQYAWGVAAGADGSTVVAGQAWGEIDFGGGPLTGAGGSDLFVAKYDDAGGLVFARLLGDAAAEVARGVAIDSSGNVLVTGAFQGELDLTGIGGPVLTSAGGDDVFVLKLDPGGAHLASAAFGDAETQRGLDVAVDPSGNIIVVGDFSGTMVLGSTSLTAAPLAGRNVFVARLGPSAAPIWAKQFGGAEDDAAHAVAADSAGNVLVAGEFGDSITFGGPVCTGAAGSDGFVVKLDPGGGFAWSHCVGASGNQEVTAIDVDAAGDVYVAGWSQEPGVLVFGSPIVTIANGDSRDTFVARIGQDGAIDWVEHFAGAANQIPRGLSLGPSGAVFVTGSNDGTADFGGDALVSAGNDDVFVLELDAGGGHLASACYGDSNDQDGNAIAVAPTGHVLVAGEYIGGLDFGGGLLLFDGGSAEDAFVARLEP